MLTGNPEIRDLPLSLEACRQQVDAFLANHGLRREVLDYYCGVFIGERMLAGGGFAGSTIKCVAADEESRGLGLISLLVTHLRQLMRQGGSRNIFVFTKPQNTEIFQGLSFTPIARAPQAVLLESDRHGVQRFTQALAEQLPSRPSASSGDKGAIVMNCNPFTLGHQYLVEAASARCSHLVVFVVQEERSAFPFEARLELARQGCAHLSNVTVVPGGDYIISSATFPSYFLKTLSDATPTHTALDIDLFASHIAPPLGITARFAGEEPLDPVTAAYNAAMQARLPQAGVAVHIIPRKESAGQVISASRVRALLKAGSIAETQPLVPHATYQYILNHIKDLTL